jgi:hypothetical protein
MRNENCSNPVVIIDHLDRCSSHGRPGKMALTLAAMIDHPQRYHDAYFTSDVDLSAVTFIATAAAADLLQPSIRDKFDVVAVPHPQPQHLPAIIASLAEDEASRLGIMTAFLPSLPPGSNEVMETLIRDRSSLRTVARAYRRMLSAAARVECGRQPAFN